MSVDVKIPLPKLLPFCTICRLIVVLLLPPTILSVVSAAASVCDHRLTRSSAWVIDLTAVCVLSVSLTKGDIMTVLLGLGGEEIIRCTTSRGGC